MTDSARRSTDEIIFTMRKGERARRIWLVCTVTLFIAVNAFFGSQCAGNHGTAEALNVALRMTPAANLGLAIITAIAYRTAVRQRGDSKRWYVFPFVLAVIGTAIIYYIAA